MIALKKHFCLLFILSFPLRFVFSQNCLDTTLIKTRYEAFSGDTLFFGAPRFNLDTVGDKISFYKSRYKAFALNDTIVNNKGNGNELLYGTRNMFPVLHGVVYRGGANNFFHRNMPRANVNPLPADALINLYCDVFSKPVYLYADAFPNEGYDLQTDAGFLYCSIIPDDEKKLLALLNLVYQIINSPNKGPVYIHGWNGWQRPPLLSAFVLKQFCGFSSGQAIAYWEQTTPYKMRGFRSIKDSIQKFVPYPKLLVPDSLQQALCPCFEYRKHDLVQKTATENLSINKFKQLLNNTIHFKSNSYNLDSTSYKALLEYAALLRRNPFLQIGLESHLDSLEGINNKDNKLAYKRLLTIKDTLLGLGIPPNRIQNQVFGSEFSAETNQNRFGRKANRRVALRVTALQFNTQFVENKYVLSDSSKQAFQTVKQILTSPYNAGIQFEIAGYTEFFSDSATHQQVSQAMAKAVYDYMLTIGISYKQLTFRGYGSTKPVVAKADSIINRRIAFYPKVIEPQIIKPANPKAYKSTRRSYSYKRKPPSPKNKTKLAYTIKSGDNLGYIASWYGVRVKDIKYWNGLYSSRIRAGKTLDIYVDNYLADKYKRINTMSFEEKQKSVGKTPKKTVSTTSSSKSHKSPANQIIKGDYVYYKIKRGDNLWDIAKHYPGVSYEDIMRLNNMKKGYRLRIGQVIKIKRK